MSVFLFAMFCFVYENTLPDDSSVIFSYELKGTKYIKSIVDAPLNIFIVHVFLLLFIDVEDLLRDFLSCCDSALSYHLEYFIWKEY